MSTMRRQLTTGPGTTTRTTPPTPAPRPLPIERTAADEHHEHADPGGTGNPSRSPCRRVCRRSPGHVQYSQHAP
ncbi:hypothetical protein [Streptomyces sp. NPDC093260]|uniref:hypothetical protein n=1 Tax=Streptomyces sp. NPDC093260 TaxID=3155073 RepID=UPI0034377A9B